MANSNHRFGAFEEAVPEFSFFKKKIPISNCSGAFEEAVPSFFFPFYGQFLFSFYGQFQSPLRRCQEGGT
jgi:hypothetical protein